MFPCTVVFSVKMMYENHKNDNICITDVEQVSQTRISLPITELVAVIMGGKNVMVAYSKPHLTKRRQIR